jgi:hypothetical protein
LQKHSFSEVAPPHTHFKLRQLTGECFQLSGEYSQNFIIEDPKTDFDIMGHQWVHQEADLRRGNSFAILAPTSGVCYHLVIHAYHVLSFYSYYRNLSLWILPRIYFWICMNIFPARIHPLYPCLILLILVYILLYYQYCLFIAIYLHIHFYPCMSIIFVHVHSFMSETMMCILHYDYWLHIHAFFPTHPFISFFISYPDRLQTHLPVLVLQI